MQRATGGTANSAVAIIAGTLPTPYSTTMGTRYANGGMLCRMSNSGVTTRLKPGLLLMMIPMKIPIRNTIGTVITTSAKVCSDGCQTPNTAKYVNAAPASSALRQPPSQWPNSAARPTTVIHGSAGTWSENPPRNRASLTPNGYASIDDTPRVS